MTTCRYCKQPLHTYVQPALIPGRADSQLGECHHDDCPLYMQTFDMRGYSTLDLYQYLTESQYVQIVTKGSK